MHSEIEAAALDGAGGAFQPRHGHTRPPGSPCANCGETLAGPWCHACGQLAEDFHRSIVRLLGEVVESLTHMDGRLWRTLPNLAVKPGRLTRDYIDGRRASQIPPLRLFLVVLLLFFLTTSLGPRQDLLKFGSPAERARVSAEIGQSNIQIGGLSRQNLALVNWLKARAQAVLQDPERFRLVLEAQEERFAFLALPVATLLLALVFVFQRRFYIFDHTIFALHSLSFQGLLLSASNILKLGVPGASLILFLAPVHLFIHMRGSYETSILGTLFRMALMAIGSLIAFTVLFLCLLVVGLVAMEPT